MKGALFAATAALFLATASIAQTPVETQTIPAEKLFPFLTNYLKLPASERDRFHPKYHLVAKGVTLKAVLKRKSGDVPMTFASDGLMQPVPTAADIAAGTQIQMSAPKGSKIGITIKIASSLPPAATMDARLLTASLDQARAGAKKAAGAASLLVPNLQRICFEGAGTGSAVMADGKTVALKTEAENGGVAKGTPCFAPKEAPNAVQIKLDRVPRNLIILK